MRPDIVEDMVAVAGLTDRLRCECLGARRVAEALGWSVYRATRVLRLMHRYLLVLRARDPLGRRGYNAYRLNPIAPRDRAGIEEWIRGFDGLRQVREADIPSYMVFDARLREYYVTGTSALCMAGECWNLVGVSSIMVAVSPEEAREARRLARRLEEASGVRYYVVVKDLGRCEYELDEGLGVNIATPIQAVVDALANRGKPGVDYYETLTTVAGRYLLDWALEPGQPMLAKLRRMALDQYPDRVSVILSPIHYMYMLLLSLGGNRGDPVSRALAMAVRATRPPRLERYERVIYEAMRGSLLGGKVAAYLGLEPLVTREGEHWVTV